MGRALGIGKGDRTEAVGRNVTVKSINPNFIVLVKWCPQTTVEISTGSLGYGPETGVNYEPSETLVHSGFERGFVHEAFPQQVFDAPLGCTCGGRHAESHGTTTRGVAVNRL